MKNRITIVVPNLSVNASALDELKKSPATKDEVGKFN